MGAQDNWSREEPTDRADYRPEYNIIANKQLLAE